jgi:hypothetical protein
VSYIAIGALDRQIWMLQFSNILIVGAGSLVFVSVLWRLVLQRTPLSVASIALIVGSLAITVPAWRSIGKVERVRWVTYARAVRLYLAFTIVVTVWVFYIVYIAQSKEISTRILERLQFFLGNRFVAYSAFDMLAVGALIGVWCLHQLLTARLWQGGLPLSDLLARFDQDRRKLRSLPRQAVPISPIRSMLFGAAAVLTYVLPVLPSAGPALLLYARRFGQPSADALLAVDNRPPVILLRSFWDDQADDLHTGQLVLAGLVLEPRLARHFPIYGPFVCIGDPRESVPKLGAMRAQRGEQEWQETVREWMTAASTIVMIAGTTKWVLWELSQCVTNGYMGKLILLFHNPSLIGGNERFARIVSALQGTIWAGALTQVTFSKSLRALSFRADGGVLIVTSDTADYTEGVHLAALIAHYFSLPSASCK